MVRVEVEQSPNGELSAEKIREQLELLVQDHVFRSSKRSIEFLRYVVEQTLKGYADQIKERTIGVEVFGRAPSYDTNMDHVVRTAAIELRKRLAIYYGEEKHRSELRMSLVPGSYIPRFTLPIQPPSLKSAWVPTPHRSAPLPKLRLLSLHRRKASHCRPSQPLVGDRRCLEASPWWSFRSLVRSPSTDFILVLLKISSGGLCSTLPVRS